MVDRNAGWPDDLGLALEADSAEAIPLIGFADDDGGFGDITFVGFENEPAHNALPSAASGVRQRLAANARQAVAAAWASFVGIGWRVRFWLVGNQLNARRTRTAAVILGALLLSLGCGVVFRGFLPRPISKQELAAAPLAAPIPSKSVLVARDQIPPGRILRATDLVWRAWPEEQLKPTYIQLGSQPISSFVGHVVRAGVGQGDPINSANIIAPGDRGFLAAVLQPGMRAVSIAITAETAASGLIMPGDDVDIMFALTVPEDDSDKSTGVVRQAVETVLRNVRVLAIDQKLAPAAGAALIGSTATLEVTPKQAEIVTLADFVAIENGKLTLTLRSLVPGMPDREPPHAEVPSYLISNDISKYMPAPGEAKQITGATIVRGGALSGPQPVHSGS